jgi:hypothetical protein
MFNGKISFMIDDATALKKGYHSINTIKEEVIF